MIADRPALRSHSDAATGKEVFSLAIWPQAALPAAPTTITSPGSGGSDGFPEVIAYGTGFLAVWNRTVGSTTSVLAQKFDASGAAVGGLMTVEAAGTNGGKAEVVDVGGGKVAVFWNTGIELRGALLNTSTGAVTSEKVIVADAADWMHDVVRLDNGNIAMVTMSSAGLNGDLKVLVIDDANMTTLSSKTIDTFAAPSNSYDHTVVSLGNGGVALYRDRDNNQLYAQKFGPTGGLSGAPLKINTTAINLPTAFDGTYFAPQAAELKGGGYVVTWMNIEGSGGDRVEVRGRVVDATGAPVGKDFLVNETSAGNQYDAQLIALDNGGFAAFWIDDVGFTRQSMIRYFDASGKALTGNLVVGTPSIFNSTVDHQLALLADGSIADIYNQGFFTGLAAEGINLPKFGTDVAETFVGTSGNDVILAAGGNDAVNMKQGGDDVVNGGGGGDTIDFENAYTAQDAVDGGDGTDTLKVSGNAYGNLTFGANLLNMEKVLLGAGFDYQFVHNDAMVANLKQLTVDGSALGAGDNLIYFGNTETNGKLNLLGGAGADQLSAGAGSDTIRAGAGNDTLHAGSAGNDSLDGGAGDDVLRMGGSLTSADRVIGGGGVDVMELGGNYGAGVVFSKTTMSGIEKILMFAGFSYNLTLHNDNVAAGALLTVDGSGLSNINTLRFDGSGETNGKLKLLGGAGADTLIGGAGDDTLSGGAGVNTYVTGAGADKVIGGAEGETFNLGAGLSATDQIDGGGGFDTVNLAGNYAGGLKLGVKTLTNIETMTLGGGFDYKLTLSNATTAAGQTFQVTAFGLGAADTLYLDGRAELDAKLSVFGGAGADTIFGGKGDDQIVAGEGANRIDLSKGGVDTASGGSSDDTFILGASLTADDRISGGGFGADHDILILSGDYSTQLAFNAFTVTGIEEIKLSKGSDYNLVVTIDAGGFQNERTLKVDGTSLASADGITLDVIGNQFTHLVALGGAGADSFFGGQGFDSLTGGGGNDTLEGRYHVDLLTGGGGSDTFRYNPTFAEIGANTIADMQSADLIDVSLIDADSGTAGDQAFVFIGTHEFNGVAGELRVQLIGSDTLLMADTNGDGFPDINVFLLTGDKTGLLSDANFVF